MMPILKYLSSVIFPVPKKVAKSSNFFEYSSREKKRIVKAAAKNAAIMQYNTLKEYEKVSKSVVPIS